MSGVNHWINNIADIVERRVRREKDESAKIVCASGISPSGPIHLGNLRELLTVHFVTEELKRRGWDVEHIHSWDDFDRFRKVPDVDNMNDNWKNAARLFTLLRYSVNPA